jgi:hypothetical protein
LPVLFYSVPNSQVDCDLTAELEQLKRGIHFKDLTISSQDHHPPPLLHSITQEKEEREEVSERASFIPMAGQCSNRLHFNMASRSPTKTSKTNVGAPVSVGGARHCRTVSQKWLERCKPDLAEFDSEPATTDSVRRSDSEGEMEEEDESEGEIKEVSDLEDSDGLCEDDLWEEREEEGEEKGVEPETFDLEECIHDNHQEGEEFQSPRLYDDDLNRVVGRSDLDLDDERQGYSWDDNDEGSSHDDSSGEDDPVINSRLSEKFNTKWKELSNSVTTLSPLKQPPLVKSSSTSLPQITTSSQTSKKRLILTPRLIPTSSTRTAQHSASNTCATQPSTLSASSTDDTKRTLFSHPRDGMSLLELYGSKSQPVAAQGKATTPSLVQQLSLSAESANQCPSSRDRRNNSDKKTSLWTLERSDHVRDFVNIDSNASLDCDTSPRQIASTDLPLHQSEAIPPPPSTQDSINLLSNRGETRLTVPGSRADSILASLDWEVDTSQRTDSSIIISDIDLLSQEEPCVLRSRGDCHGSAVSMATTSSGRGLRRRGREKKVHSTAAIISEVEQLEYSEEVADTPTHTARSEPAGVTPLKGGAGRDSKVDERERKVASYGHSR